MAGSKRWFAYTLDDGTSGGIVADESNVEALNGTAANPPNAATAPTRQVPKGTRLRFAVYGVPNGRQIKIPILNQTIYNALPASFSTIPDPLGGTVPLPFLRKRPEIVKSPVFGIDTGLTDGDNP